MNIAILGGTGKEGAGLALRWAQVGHSIIIGSRDVERARAKAAELRELSKRLPIIGHTNREAAELGEVIVLAVGPLSNAGPLEAITAVLATINRRYKLKNSGITITGL